MIGDPADDEALQYAMKIIENCRLKEINTPFLRLVLQDGEKGSSLSNSQIAEECMGGM